MKIFDFLKSTRKNFSVKKYIKPINTQEYYNNLHYQRVKDKRKFQSSTSTQSVFPMQRALHPDLTQSQNEYDERNEHYMYKLHRRVKELEERTDKHIQYAKASLELKNSKKAFFTKKLKTDELSREEETNIDRATGLVYGLGFDEFIQQQDKKLINEETTQENENQLENLVNKLGYLDFRDFVALNKYIIEANSHEDLVNQTKSTFLNLAIQKMTQKKKEEMRKNFRKIDEANKDLKSRDRNEMKIEFLLENVEESRDLFYNYYYKLKEMNTRDEMQSLNEFEKYDKMIKSLNNTTNNISNDKDIEFHKQNKSNYDLNDYMERIIKTYRDQRTVEFNTDSQNILNKYKSLCEKFSKKGMNDINLIWDRAVTMAKYQTFMGKYKKIYVPTNIETERMINNYLREKRLKEFTMDKMMQEEDPNFSSISDEEGDLSKIYDEDSKRIAMEKQEMKRKYFDAKYEYRLKKLEENIDSQLADELGIVLLQEEKSKTSKEAYEFEDMMLNMGSNKTPKFEFIENYVNDHYKSFKLDYMYNYMDFFSNKYRVRRKIAEEMKRKVSLKEINYILNNLVDKDLNKKTMKYSILDFVNAEYGKIKPGFIETLTECDTGDKRKDEERKNSVKTAIKNVENKNIEIDEGDKFEIELYKGIKNDPYFKHYLYNNFAYFAETMNDIVSGFPYINKGFKTDDYVRYEQLRNVKKLSETEMSKAISENKSEIIDSLQINLNSENNEIISSITPTLNTKKTRNEIYHGKGKRKRCRATADLTKGNGTITVNGRSFYNYFPFSPNRAKVLIPLQLTETICDWNIKLTIQGGGSTGQAEAAIPAISKALLKINPEWRQILAKNWCLRHDPRNVEPKKPGKIKARKGYVYNRR